MSSVNQDNVSIPSKQVSVTQKFHSVQSTQTLYTLHVCLLILSNDVFVQALSKIRPKNHFIRLVDFV